MTAVSRCAADSTRTVAPAIGRRWSSRKIPAQELVLVCAATGRQPRIARQAIALGREEGTYEHIEILMRTAEKFPFSGARSKSLQRR